MFKEEAAQAPPGMPLGPSELLSQLLAAFAGAWFGGLRQFPAECHCHADESTGALGLLGRQLDRCGPANLHKADAGVVSVSYLLFVTVGAAAVGFALGFVTAVFRRDGRARAAGDDTLAIGGTSFASQLAARRAASRSA